MGGGVETRLEDTDQTLQKQSAYFPFLVFCGIRQKFGPCEENDTGMENVRVAVITITL